ncbi:hypothetical protein QYE76_049169 [Lolium multiflorum]|uniref:Jacalin-type lectin domain-containing protein n=1 Tax=Lolium multiflorum TaxID=4521 RepID=A0AAD8SND2_LOLMU|nr:hypothetical protein QYE76_049169 [Lolium multiflorum]
MPSPPRTSSLTAGHLICSSCHDNLPDKNKCASCVVTSFVRTSYSRCHAVEAILRSFRVACPDAISESTAGKMLYHEKAEHEKTCPSVIPRLVLKIGPCGGVGGQVREMDVRGVNRIVKVVVCYRVNTVDAMTVFYERDGREEKTDRWGIPVTECYGKPSEVVDICLEQDEYLTGVKGHIDYYGDWLCVSSLTFVTNLHTFGPYGEEDGTPFELPAAAGGRIVGFHGRSDSYLDAIGTYVKMDI